MFRYQEYQDLDASLDHFLSMINEDETHTGIFIDTINGIIARKQAQDKDGRQRSISDETMGVRAKILTDFFGRASHPVRVKDQPVVLFSQLRRNLDSQTARYHPDEVPGGTALHHNARVVIFVKRGASVKDGKERLGFELIWKVEKAQVGMGIAEGNQFRTVFFTHEDCPTQGFDPVYEVANVAIHCGVLCKKNQTTLQYTDSQGNIHLIGGSATSLATTVLQNLRKSDPVEIPGKKKSEPAVFIPLWMDMESEIDCRLMAEADRRQKASEDLPPFSAFPDRFGGVIVTRGDDSDEEDQLTDDEEIIAGAAL